MNERLGLYACFETGTSRHPARIRSRRVGKGRKSEPPKASMDRPYSFTQFGGADYLCVEEGPSALASGAVRNVSGGSTLR
jgi:hypothetical protein